VSFREAYRPVRTSIPGGDPIANRHKWRIDHESLETWQTKELSKFSLNFLFFFNWNNLFHYLHLMAVVTELSKCICFEKKSLFKQCIFIFLNVSIQQPNFLVVTWRGIFGDRVVHPGSKYSCINTWIHATFPEFLEPSGHPYWPKLVTSFQVLPLAKSFFWNGMETVIGLYANTILW
jgi:hypothetical protein